MAIVACPECSKEISDKAQSCPNCGAPQEKKQNLETVENSAHDVSFAWTLLFGAFYLWYKGWFKSGLVAIVIAFVSGGFGWLIVPFFAKQLVNYFED